MPEETAKQTVYNERRATDRALRLWDTVRDDAPMPRLRDIASGANGKDWANVVLLRLDHLLTNSVVIACGTAARAALDVSRLGETLLNVLPRSITDQICKAIRSVMQSNTPERVEGTYEREDGTVVRYRSIFMPVEDSMRRPDYVMCAFSSDLRA
jgi:hypothetical protein